MPEKVKTYRQNRPEEWLEKHPQERWRCDIFAEDGSDHHGVGATPEQATANARRASRRWSPSFYDCVPETSKKRAIRDWAHRALAYVHAEAPVVRFYEPLRTFALTGPSDSACVTAPEPVPVGTYWRQSVRVEHGPGHIRAYRIAFDDEDFLFAPSENLYFEKRKTDENARA